jgi:hypothetical protein
MGDVVSLEVDGDPVGPQLERIRTRPTWGMPAALVLVGALVLGVGWSLVARGGAPSALSRAAVTTPTTARSTPSTADAPLVVAGMPTTAPVTSPLDVHDPVEAAGAALSAWGEFAGSGDLSQVRATFVAEGPQLRQLEQEAARMDRAPGEGYRVALSDVTVDGSEGVRTVTGIVTWSRSGEADQVYRWAIELRSVEGTWRLFTVRAPLATEGRHMDPCRRRAVRVAGVPLVQLTQEAPWLRQRIT